MTRGWTEGKPWEIAWGELRWEGAAKGWTEGKPWEIAWGEFHQCDCPEKLCAQEFSSGLLGDRTCIASLAGSDTKNALLLARVFHDKFHQ